MQSFDNDPWLREIVKKQSQFGKVKSIDHYIITAENMSGSRIYDTVKVGQNQLIGEIIKLSGDLAYIQCFNSLSGICVGQIVEKTHHPLCADLGPGILEQIFNGSQKPLNLISQESSFLPFNLNFPSLDTKKLWMFEPLAKQGDMLSQGDIFGSVFENNLLPKHQIMMPPKSRGKILFIAPTGDYSINEQVLQVQLNGRIFKYSLSHKWPIRSPRPIKETLSSDTPLVTGQRVLDVMFPTPLGGICTYPGLFGKGFIYQSIAKNSNTDISFFVSNGQKGSEVAAILQALACMTDKKNQSILKKSSIFINTPDSPHLNLYTGMTIAEYYRDMGKNVCLLVDSLSMWLLNEKQATECQPFGGRMYSGLLKDRIIEIYQRVRKVNCLGRPFRSGSVTLVGALSFLIGDNQIENQYMLNASHTFLAIDRKLAQFKHFPSVNWIESKSMYLSHLSPYFCQIDQNFIKYREIFGYILETQQKIHEKFTTYSKQALQPKQQLILETANIIKNNFLHQNNFLESDFTCPLQKTVGMMKCITSYYETSLQQIQKYTQMQSTKKLEPIQRRLRTMVFESPQQSSMQFRQFFQKLYMQIKKAFD